MHLKKMDHSYVDWIEEEQDIPKASRSGKIKLLKIDSCQLIIGIMSHPV
jgi:hypothetical protein